MKLIAQPDCYNAGTRRNDSLRLLLPTLVTFILAVGLKIKGDLLDGNAVVSFDGRHNYCIASAPICMFLHR